MYVLWRSHFDTFMFCTLCAYTLCSNTIWTIWAMDRTLARPQVNLSLLLSKSLKFQPLNYSYISGLSLILNLRLSGIILSPLIVAISKNFSYKTLTFFFRNNDIVQIPKIFHSCVPLKGPKCEIFVAGIFAQIRPIWIGDLGTRPKNPKKLYLGP
jgi:hypothetical protein